MQKPYGNRRETVMQFTMAPLVIGILKKFREPLMSVMRDSLCRELLPAGEKDNFFTGSRGKLISAPQLAWALREAGVTEPIYVGFYGLKHFPTGLTSPEPPSVWFQRMDVPREWRTFDLAFYPTMQPEQGKNLICLFGSTRRSVEVHRVFCHAAGANAHSLAFGTLMIPAEGRVIKSTQVYNAGIVHKARTHLKRFRFVATESRRVREALEKVYEFVEYVRTSIDAHTNGAASADRAKKSLIRTRIEGKTRPSNPVTFEEAKESLQGRWASCLCYTMFDIMRACCILLTCQLT